MKPSDASRSPWEILGPLLTSALSLSLLSQPARAMPIEDKLGANGGHHQPNDPFAVLDPEPVQPR
ncbi:hypothetical protein ACJ73_04994 [Blastomyces percursus]|uniref:Uncharacterized protein n=1 Tax=Blastomyces percursus TaxID=1658174 RepID=A0A1J9R7N6_9EURO|nr:hypothetical protein ACJ73_04994 [Blastomyces percursus]